MGSAMQESLSLQERLALVLTAAQGVLGFDRINILLADPDRTMLRSVASVGVDEPIEQIRVPLGREGGGIARAFVERRPVVWDGAGPVPPDWRLAPPYSEIGAFRSRSFVNLPLLVRGEAIGVLGADNKFSRRPPSPEIVRLLQVFAAQAAVAIENARLYEEVAGYARELEQRVEERTRALKEAQAKLIQSAKLAAVGTLAAGVAHELNQPLMVIRGYAQELLAGGRRSFEEMREDLGRIEAQTSRMAAIIGQLMEFSRRSEGRRGLTDLNEVVFQALALLGQQVRARNIVLTQDLQPGLPPVWADPLQLEQVLVNLITNARDAMEVWGRGVLQVRTRAAGDGRVAVSVTDSGPGIPPHLLKRIFDPFFTTKEVGKGTGLGLSICHGIVEEHGGEILVESPVAEGRGARFTVLLPAAGGDGRGERR
jgi:signal transduction histidine kinase